MLVIADLKAVEIYNTTGTAKIVETAVSSLIPGKYKRGEKLKQLRLLK
jgi:hypothetical protein